MGIASLTVTISDLSQYASFKDIPNIKMFLICANALLQALIAWRAYIDTSIVDNKPSALPAVDASNSNIKLLVEDKS